MDADYCREIRSRAVRAVVLANLIKPFLRALSDQGPERAYESANREFQDLWDRVSEAASVSYLWIGSVISEEDVQFVREEAAARHDVIMSSQEQVDREFEALQSHIERGMQAFLAAIDGVDPSEPSADSWRALGDLVRKLAYEEDSRLYIRRNGH